MTQEQEQGPSSAQKKLFWACFIALVATAFTFMLRVLALDEIQVQFGLSETQKGEIFGAGLWPFSISIVLFSLVIDRIGYGKAIAFAFVAHVLFAVLTITAKGYGGLYAASVLGGLAAGAIEAAINPLVASMFTRQKTKWLNMLHAGWPGGLMLAGAAAMWLAPEGVIGRMFGGLEWQGKIALVFVPVLAYGILMSRLEFPMSERVVAGVPFREMLAEVGFLGALLTSFLMFREVGRVFEWSNPVTWGVIAATSIGFGLYVRAIGRPLFLILMMIMVPLAITELGTDSWISSLMNPPMEAIGLQGGWVLVYTAFLMMVLRFSAGPIVHKLKPLGLLAVSAFLAIIGLVFLSKAAGVTILVAATIYGCGKTFFWPTMLGVVSEQFPRGGALTLNLIGGIGMLSAGIIGSALLGNIQDKQIDHALQSENAALHAELMGAEQISVFGTYRPLDGEKLAQRSAEERTEVADIQAVAKKNALATVAIFPGVMLVSYLLLILWFQSRGGYKPVVLEAS